MRVLRTFTAFCVCLSDTAGHGPTPAGMAGLRHKTRHTVSEIVLSVISGLSVLRQPTSGFRALFRDLPGREFRSGSTCI